MIEKKARNVARLARHERVRKTVHGTGERPRLCVFRSEQHIYAQLIDDVKGVTLCAASTVDAELKGKTAGSNIEGAKQVGTLIAQRAQANGIKQVVFDRGGYIYHGRVAALAAAAREAGLEF